VTADGWDLDAEAPQQTPRLIYLTPSCQFPLGLTMPVEQRQKLLDIAAAQGSWVIEDDFDCEYRFDVGPVPALYSASSSQRIIYVGTFAKTLFPALRLGFMVLPIELARRLRRAISITGQFPPLILQATLAEFIEQGHFALHLRRMRRLYAKRRALFVDHCTEQLGSWVTPVPGSTGIQTTWLLDAACSDADLAEAARDQGVVVAPLSTHYRHGSPRNGLVLGYAALEESVMLKGFAVLRNILSAAPG
jgi:GntR family transcriptional regulator/MocR family aminotransferase